MHFEYAVVCARRVIKITFDFKEYICRNTGDRIEKQSKIIVTREVQTKSCGIISRNREEPELNFWSRWNIVSKYGLML